MKPDSSQSPSQAKPEPATSCANDFGHCLGPNLRRQTCKGTTASLGVGTRCQSPVAPVSEEQGALFEACHFWRGSPPIHKESPKEWNGETTFQALVSFCARELADSSRKPVSLHRKTTCRARDAEQVMWMDNISCTT